MIKITKLPAIIQKQSREFKNLFKNKAQFKHFKEYVTGLMLCDNKTFMGIQAKFVDASSINSLDHFMIRADWSEQEINSQRITQLQHRNDTASKPDGVVAIDDTLTHKTGKQMEDAEYHFDHSTRKYVLGHNIVSTQYKDRQVSYPLDYRQYYRKPTNKQLQKQYKKLDKQINLFQPKQYLLEKLKLLLDYQRRLQRFKSKIALAMELIQQAEAMGIKATTYLFDSWFLCKLIVTLIACYGKDWISVLKSNRNLMIKNKKMPVSDYIKTIPPSCYRQITTKAGKCYWVFSKVIQVCSLGKVRLVISYNNHQLNGDPVVFVTNRKDWEPVKILSTYELRWSIDAFYRDAKQHLGLEAYQLRTGKGIKRHWYFVFLAYTLLMLNVQQSRLLRRFKANLSTIGESSRALADEVTLSLILWIYKNFKNNKNVDEVLQCLIN
jgi:SRSO17 transposase